MAHDKGAGMEMKLKIRNLVCSYGPLTAVDDISIDLCTGETLCVIGPNGAGKTSLFKSILGIKKYSAGSISVNGIEISSLPAKQRAELIGYVPQVHNPPFAFRVFDIVLLGRIKETGLFSGPSAADEQLAEEVLHMLNITHLKDRLYTEISGGEKQLVLIARALAQQPRFLILDEPANNLDYGNQLRVLRKTAELAKEGLGIIMTSHHPVQAARFADRVAAMKNGRILFEGSPEAVVTGEYIREIYDIDSELYEYSF